MDIIDFIVSEQKAQAAQIEVQKIESIPVLDELTVFKDNNPKGLLEKEKFKVVFTTNKLSLIPIKQFFDAISDQQKFTTTPFAQTNKKGEKYYWIKQYGKFGMTEYKLPYFEGLDELMAAYLFGLFRFKIDFKALYEEAIK